MTALSDTMIRLRKQIQFSQQELADALGLKRSAISMYESGKREPDLKTLKFFADFYNIDMNTLTSWVPPTSQEIFEYSKSVCIQSSVPIVSTITTGQRMKDRRKMLGLSAEFVAQKLGISPATMYRYENGDIEKIPGARLGDLAVILKTTPAFLMGWTHPNVASGVFMHNKIREVRKQRNLTMKELGVAIGVEENLIYQYEAGTLIPDEETFSLLAKYFGATYDYLTGSKDFFMTNKEIFALNLQKYMNESSITRTDLADALGISYYTVTDWVRGKKYPRIEKIEQIAKYFGVKKSDLIEKTDSIPTGFIPVPETVRVPLLGKIACGEPILAEENINDYVDVPRGRKVDFCLLCTGDSMIDAGIHDGDIVFIHHQPDVENGEIAAVRIGCDATLKRVYKQDGFISLNTENKKYPPFIFREGDSADVTIIGKAVGFQHWY